MNRRPIIVRLCHIRSILILFIPVIVAALASGFDRGVRGRITAAGTSANGSDSASRGDA